MSQQEEAYDIYGLNVLDPHDTLGRKTKYITLLHEMALERYLPAPGSHKVALDVGCGFGRLTHILRRKGYTPVGVDPSYHLLAYARRLHPTILFVQAQMPDLPISSCGLILLQNVLRTLRILGNLEAINTLHHYLVPDGFLVVVENIRKHPDYFQRESLLGLLREKGYSLQMEVPIRFGRWWFLYLIRYGLVPEKWLHRVAAYELDKAKRWVLPLPPWQYVNFLFVFRAPKRA